MRKINKIIIHCSATKEGKNFTVKDIDVWHRQRGFDRIGYHYIVYLDGSIHPGRPETVIGAHTKGMNATSIGICYIGGLNADGKPKDTRTPEQRQSMKKLVSELKTKYPGATVHGHREFAAKDCPCFDAGKEF